MIDRNQRGLRSGYPGYYLPHLFRLMSFDRPLAAWRRTRAEADADALELGVGSREGGTGPLYLTVPAWIRTCSAREAERLDIRPVAKTGKRLREVGDFHRCSAPR